MTRRNTPRTDADFDSLLPQTIRSRRDFIASAIGAGFALAVQPVMAQQAISTDTQGLLAGPVEIPVSDGKISAYRAQPAKGSSFPIVLVISEIFGVHEYIADICRRLAKRGYCALAPDLFQRQGDPRKLESVQAIRSQIIEKVADAQVMSDLDATLAWATKAGADAARIGVTGFCWGGRETWLYCAHNPKVKAAVAWYGRLSDDKTPNQPTHPIDIAASLKTPVLGLYGGQDQGIPLSQVEEMKKTLRAAGSKSEIHIYPDAPHAFHADYRPSYRKADAEDGWQRLLAWFKKNGL